MKLVDKILFWVCLLIIVGGIFFAGRAYQMWKMTDDVEEVRQGCEKSYKPLFPETKDKDLLDDCLDYILNPGG